MSNEIAQSHEPSTDDLYAIVTRLSDGYIYDVGDAALEAVGTWNDARIQECAIDMTFSGGSFYADFPTAITDIDEFHVQVRVAAAGAGSEAITDWIKSQGQISWSVDGEITIGLLGESLNTVQQVVEVPEETETRTRIYI
jgi:hypothetical protein